MKPDANTGPGMPNVFDAEPRAPLRRSSAPASSWIATLLDEPTRVATLQQLAPNSRAGHHRDRRHPAQLTLATRLRARVLRHAPRHAATLNRRPAAAAAAAEQGHWRTARTRSIQRLCR